MREREFYLPSSDGKTKLRCVEWMPDGNVRAWVQLVHGMNEHMGRYREFAGFLAARGIAVLGHDCLGHGKTARPKANMGSFAAERGERYLIRDIRRVARFGRRKYPGLRHILLGHSMGSFLVRRYLSVYGDDPDGVILLGTGFPSPVFIKEGQRLADAVCHFRGRRYKSRILYDLSLGAYNRKFRPVKTAYDWLTRDEARAKQFSSDPLCDFRFSAGAYRDFFQVILDAQRAEKKGAFRHQIPVLILAGDRDTVGENARGVRRLAGIYERAGVRDLTLGLYKGARHELLNETNRAEVFGDLFEWISDRIS